MKEDVSIKPLCDYRAKSFYLFSHHGFTEELLTIKEECLHLISSSDMVMFDNAINK